MKRISLALAIGTLTPLYAQLDSLALKYAATITQEDLRRHLTVFSSDEFEGRETGLPGQKRAAAYLRNAFASFGIGAVPGAEEHGLKEGYEQVFDLEYAKPGGIAVRANGRDFLFMQDYFYFSEKLPDSVVTSELLFAGNGDAEAYSRMNARDRVVLAVMSPSTVGNEDLMAELQQRTAAAETAGASVLIVATARAPELMKEYEHWITSPRLRLAYKKKNGTAKGVQTILVGEELSAELLKGAGLDMPKAIKKSRKPGRALPCSLRLLSKREIGTMTGENVLGYIEGTDKKEEIVVVTAHYDHIGAHDGEVYNGADDDGSGTVALLEMAEAFAKARAEGHGPRRSVLFMPVSGEEKGLLGSEFYSDHPVFPLENTICDLNIDMIGRVDSAHATSVPYVYIIGSDRLSTQLHQVNEQANSTYVGLELDYSFNSKDDPNRFYFRSDHYNFARRGVPVIFYFSGVHEDYHQPGDEVEKIRFDLLQKRALLVFHTAWALAGRDQRLIVDGKIEE